MSLVKRSLILLLLFCSNLQAQEEFVPPPAKHITSFSFRLLTGGIIIVRATVSNFPDSLNFILDTGSGGISLDSITADELKIKAVPSDRTIRGIAGIRQVRFANNNTLHLPGLSVDSLNFHINDYGVLTSAYGERIDGIIGYSFLSKYIVKVDYDSLRLHVFTKGTMKYPRGGFLIRPLLVNIPIFSAGLKDAEEVTSRFYFDTGAGMCLLLSSEFVDDSTFIGTKRKWYNTQAEGLGGKAAMKQGVIRQVKLGPYKFRNVPTYVFDDVYNVTSYPYLGGLIGNDLLRRFNLILNYDRRDIYMTPNSHYKDPFDYSYTGLGIYMVNGLVEVSDIMVGSPAEKAGFRPGDIIMAINNNFSQSIQQYKNMMQDAGVTLKVLVNRPEGLTMLTLKVKSIF